VSAGERNSASGVNWKLLPDLETVMVTFLTEPPLEVTLRFKDLEQHITSLGGFRALMKPEIPREFPLGQRVQVIPDPIWVSEPEMMRGDTLLHIRDPRYGWLHYMLTKSSTEKLAKILTNQLAARPPEQSPDKPN